LHFTPFLHPKGAGYYNVFGTFSIFHEPQFSNFLIQKACTPLSIAFPQHPSQKGLIYKDLKLPVSSK